MGWGERRKEGRKKGKDEERKEGAEIMNIHIKSTVDDRREYKCKANGNNKICNRMLCNMRYAPYVAAREIALMAKLIDLRRKIAAHKKRNETTTIITEKAYEY